MTYTSKSFSDKIFFRNILIAIIAASVTIYIAFHTLVGYASMSAIALSSVALGLLEPRRGWFLALVYSGIIIIFWLIHPIKPLSEDLAMFSSYLSFFVSLIFGFIISLVGRLFEK